MEKICKMCKKSKSFDDFPTDNRSKDGKWRFCRQCESGRKKKYRSVKKAAVKIINIPLPTISRKKYSLNYINIVGAPIPESYYEHVLGLYFSKDNSIFLNLPVIDNFCKVFNCGFSQFHNGHKFTFMSKLCGTLNHEVLHAVIKETDGKIATKKWDNIASKLEIDGYL